MNWTEVNSEKCYNEQADLLPDINACSPWNTIVSSTARRLLQHVIFPHPLILTQHIQTCRQSSLHSSHHIPAWLSKVSCLDCCFACCCYCYLVCDYTGAPLFNILWPYPSFVYGHRSQSWKPSCDMVLLIYCLSLPRHEKLRSDEAVETGCIGKIWSKRWITG